jgi:hypothetical protein
MMKNEKPETTPILPLQSAYLDLTSAMSDIQWAQNEWTDWTECVLFIRLARESLEAAEAKIKATVGGLE